MFEYMSYIKYVFLAGISHGERKERYRKQKRQIKKKIAMKKFGPLGVVLENYMAYYKFYLFFKQHYGITIPADVCGNGNAFDLVKIKLKDIKREWIGGKVYSLQETSPYQFLQTRDEKIYEQYIQKHIRMNLLPENTLWNTQQFLDLEKSILEEGYNP